jgi:hypothetical protein
MPTAEIRNVRPTGQADPEELEYCALDSLTVGRRALKKPDDLNDVVREERSRGRKRPLDTDTLREQADRKAAILRIFRRGNREDLRVLLKTWGYSKEEIEAALKEYDAALEQQSF